MLKTVFCALLLAAGIFWVAEAAYSCDMSKLVIGKYHGESQQCVALVKSTCSSSYGCGICGAPATSNWKKGAKVRGNNIKANTPIATFNSAGKYEGHAAIYERQDSNGLWVADQWAGQPANRRQLRFGNTNNDPVNNGDKFYVIE